MGEVDGHSSVTSTSLQRVPRSRCHYISLTRTHVDGLIGGERVREEDPFSAAFALTALFAGLRATETEGQREQVMGEKDLILVLKWSGTFSLYFP